MTSRNEALPRHKNLFTILAESDTESELSELSELSDIEHIEQLDNMEGLTVDIQTVENSIRIEPVV